MNKHFLAPIFFLALLASCSKQGQQTLLQETNSKAAFSKPINTEETQRKISYNASLEVAVEKPDTIAKSITNKIIRLGGTLQSRQNYTFNFKVKPNDLRTLFSEIKQLGTVKSEYIGSQDITDAFYDTEARLENLKKVRERYLQLLDKAETVQDILSVEKELERINGDIDVLQGRLNRIQSQVSMADLTVTIKQRKKAGVLGAIGKGIYNGVKWLFVRG